MPMLDNIATTVVEVNKVKPKININNLHTIWVTVARLQAGWLEKALDDAVGDYKTCEAYSVAKARQKDINKDLKGSSITPGEGST